MARVHAVVIMLMFYLLSLIMISQKSQKYSAYLFYLSAQSHAHTHTHTPTFIHQATICTMLRLLHHPLSLLHFSTALCVCIVLFCYCVDCLLRVIRSTVVLDERSRASLFAGSLYLVKMTVKPLHLKSKNP